MSLPKMRKSKRDRNRLQKRSRRSQAQSSSTELLISFVESVNRDSEIENFEKTV